MWPRPLVCRLTMIIMAWGALLLHSLEAAGSPEAGLRDMMDMEVLRLWYLWTLSFLFTGFQSKLPPLHVCWEKQVCVACLFALISTLQQLVHTPTHNIAATQWIWRSVPGSVNKNHVCNCYLDLKCLNHWKWPCHRKHAGVLRYAAWDTSMFHRSWWSERWTSGNPKRQQKLATKIRSQR